jgi:hypothetical protein
MEMDDVEFIQYIDDMIAVLQDGKELLNRPESIAAVAILNEVLTFNLLIYLSLTKELECGYLLSEFI